jgi:hypothetical protein
MEADDPIAIVIEVLNPFQPALDDTDNLYRLYQLFEGFRSLPDRDRAAPAMFSPADAPHRMHGQPPAQYRTAERQVVAVGATHSFCAPSCFRADSPICTRFLKLLKSEGYSKSDAVRDPVSLNDELPCRLTAAKTSPSGSAASVDWIRGNT